MNYMLKFWVVYYVLLFGEVVVMIRMSGLSLARHWHGLVVQMKGLQSVGEGGS